MTSPHQCADNRMRPGDIVTIHFPGEPPTRHVVTAAGCDVVHLRAQEEPHMTSAPRPAATTDPWADAINAVDIGDRPANIDALVDRAQDMLRAEFATGRLDDLPARAATHYVDTVYRPLVTALAEALIHTRTHRDRHNDTANFRLGKLHAIRDVVLPDRLGADLDDIVVAVQQLAARPPDAYAAGVPRRGDLVDRVIDAVADTPAGDGLAHSQVAVIAGTAVDAVWPVVQQLAAQHPDNAHSTDDPAVDRTRRRLGIDANDPGVAAVRRARAHGDRSLLAQRSAWVRLPAAEFDRLVDTLDTPDPAPVGDQPDVRPGDHVQWVTATGDTWRGVAADPVGPAHRWPDARWVTFTVLDDTRDHADAHHVVVRDRDLTVVHRPTDTTRRA